MKLTLINTQNIYYFEGLIGKYWQEDEMNRLFVGVIDDNNTAVCAAVFVFYGQIASLKFIATDPNHRRKGYATFLIRESLRLLGTSMAKSLNATVFVEKGDIQIQNNISQVDKVTIEGEEGAFLKLLESVGASIHAVNIQRSVYKLGDIEKQLSAKTDDNVKALNELSEHEKAKIVKIEEDNEDILGYINPNVYLSDKNIYGKFYVKDDDIKAMVACRKFVDGVLVDSIYAKSGELKQLVVLYKAVLQSVLPGCDKDTRVYIDTFGDKLQEYQQSILQCEPVETFIAYVASMDIQ